MGTHERTEIARDPEIWGLAPEPDQPGHDPARVRAIIMHMQSCASERATPGDGGVGMTRFSLPTAPQKF